MSDKSLVVSADSWHARRFRANAGSAGTANLCHYFWVVAKSLAVSLVSIAPIRGLRKRAGAIFLGAMAVFGSTILLFLALMLLSMFLIPVIWLVNKAIGSVPTPQNIAPLLAMARGGDRPMTQSDLSGMLILLTVVDCFLVVLLTVTGVYKYNEGHQAGFIRLSWERFKTWKDGSVVCPIIEFEETN